MLFSEISSRKGRIDYRVKAYEMFPCAKRCMSPFSLMSGRKEIPSRCDGRRMRWNKMTRWEYEATKDEDTKIYPQKSGGLLIKTRASFAALLGPTYYHNIQDLIQTLSTAKAREAWEGTQRKLAHQAGLPVSGRGSGIHLRHSSVLDHEIRGNMVSTSTGLSGGRRHGEWRRRALVLQRLKNSVRKVQDERGSAEPVRSLSIRPRDMLHSAPFFHQHAHRVSTCMLLTYIKCYSYDVLKKILERDLGRASYVVWGAFVDGH